MFCISYLNVGYKGIVIKLWFKCIFLNVNWMMGGGGGFVFVYCMVVFVFSDM